MPRITKIKCDVCGIEKIENLPVELWYGVSTDVSLRAMVIERYSETGCYDALACGIGDLTALVDRWACRVPLSRETALIPAESPRGGNDGR
jgi:hypothetical protein